MQLYVSLLKQTSDKKLSALVSKFGELYKSKDIGSYLYNLGYEFVDRGLGQVGATFLFLVLKKKQKTKKKKQFSFYKENN
jgi:hypothetical protein